MAGRKKEKVQARNEEIRKQYASGKKTSELANEYFLSVGSIYQICRGINKRKSSAVPKEEPREEVLEEQESVKVAGAFLDAKLSDPPIRIFRETEGEERLNDLIERLEDLVNRTCGLVDLYESQGFYENRLISTVKNYRFSQMAGSGSGVVMIIQVPDIKKAKEAARKGFVRFLPEK